MKPTPAPPRVVASTDRRRHAWRKPGTPKPQDHQISAEQREWRREAARLRRSVMRRRGDDK